MLSFSIALFSKFGVSMIKCDFKSFFRSAPEKLDGFPVGSRVYKGFQGSGKTLSMVHYTLKMLEEYPDCLCFSNIMISNPRVTYFSTPEELQRILTITNGVNGVLVVLDEAHLFWGRKGGISLDVLTAISQQRKDRRRIVLSSQIWEELDISLRKQVKEIVQCNSIMRTIIINRVYDGETLTYDKMQSQYVADLKDIYIYHMTKDEVSKYNTYQKIVTNNDYERSSSSSLMHLVTSVNLKK